METVSLLIFAIFIIIIFYSFMKFVGTKLTKKKDASGANTVVGIVFITFTIIIYKIFTNYDGAITELLAVGIVIGVPIALVLISDYYKKKK